jgi:hypothetical protein
MGAGLGALLLYSTTACRTIFTGDSPELAAAAACFGVPHPPGYPLYTLLTGLWVHLFPVSQRALAANLASALHGALAAVAFVLLLRRLEIGRLGAIAAVAILMFGRTVWALSAAAEVYAFDLLLLVWAGLAVARAAQRDRKVDWLGAGLTVGLWLGHRFLNFAYAPWLVGVALAARRSTARPFHWEHARGPALAGLLASALPFLYLPLASARNPAIDIGDPQTLANLGVVISGAPFARYLGGDAGTAAAHLGRWFADLPQESGIGLVLAAAGLALGLTRRGPRRFLALGLAWLLAANWIVLTIYNIPDFRSYCVPSILAVAGLSAIGADAALGSASRRTTVRARAVGAGLIALSCLGLPLNFRANDLRTATLARDAGVDLLRCAPPRSVLFVQGDTQVHAVWYLQKIEGRAPEVLVISPAYHRAWYYKQLRKSAGGSFPEYREGETAGAFFYRVLEWAGTDRRVLFAFDPTEFSRRAAGPWWSERTVVPVGWLFEAWPKAVPLDRPALARWNASFWAEAREGIASVRGWSDLETKSTALKGVLAQVYAADFAERQGLAAEARSLYEGVLALRPAEWDREVVEALTRRGTPVDPEGRARTGLERLRR